MKKNIANCVFCKIIQKKLPATIVFQDSVCTAFLPKKCINRGHVILTTNQQYEHYFDIDDKTLNHIFSIQKN